MAAMIQRCNDNETAACCCVDVGTVIDNRDCTAVWQGLFTDRPQAETTLRMLVAKARQVESEPCDIQSEITHTAEGVELNCRFSFSCQAEMLIFQLALR